MILDVTCCGKEMWKDNNPKDVIFMDRRAGLIEIKGKDWTRATTINPDVKADNRFLPFKDKSFDMVVFDPPHEIGKPTGIFQQLYSTLNPLTWRSDLYKALKESLRVLAPGSFLIFKWAECKKAVDSVVQLIKAAGFELLFSCNTHYRTYWLTARSPL